MMKKWVLISMLFVGISLTVYAVVPQAIIALKTVTPTTAEISVQYLETEGIGWGIVIEGSNDIFDFGLCTEVEGPDEDGHYCSTVTITGLAPNTLYRVIILIYEDINDIENSAYRSGSIIFRTPLE